MVSICTLINSRSYRRFASKSLEPIIKRTHVSIWKWIQKYSILAADRFVIGKRQVKRIFVDETLLKINKWSTLLVMVSIYMNQICIRVCCYSIYQQKELSLYVI